MEFSYSLKERAVPTLLTDSCDTVIERGPTGKEDKYTVCNTLNKRNQRTTGVQTPECFVPCLQ